MEQSPQEANSHSSHLEISYICWIRRFVTILARASYWSVS